MTQWLSIEKASLAINVSSRTMHRYIKSGKVRTKKIGNARLVSKDSLENFAMNPEATTNGNDENTLINNFDSNKKRPEFSPPTGYVIIDNETLDSLRSQIKSLTESVGQMQSTQKLLIEKGLNLGGEAKELPISVIKTEAANNKNDQEFIDKSDTQISPLANIGDDFFQTPKTQRRDKDKSLILILTVTFLLIASIVVANWLL